MLSSCLGFIDYNDGPAGVTITWYE
jgi:hypothetical protein